MPLQQPDFQVFSISPLLEVRKFSGICTLLSRITHASIKQLSFCSQRWYSHDRVTLSLNQLHLWRGSIDYVGPVLHVHTWYMAEVVATSANISCRQIISH